RAARLRRRYDRDVRLQSGGRRRGAVAPQRQFQPIQLEKELVEIRLREQAGDFRDILRRERHLRPPKIDMTWVSGLAAALATGAHSFADHTVSGRLCSSN